MPELPEVEAAARRLRRWLVGRTIAELRPTHRSTRAALPAAAARACRGRTVTAVTRRGKSQCVELDDGARLAVHFGMTGDWVRLAPGDEAGPFARVVLRCDDGSGIALDDPRVLGWVKRLPPGAVTRAEAALGPEADDPTLTGAWLHAALHRRRGHVKPALMDQHLLAGLGNIYAAEACWHAGIHPATPCNRISRPRAERLLHGIRLALADGMKHQGRYADGSRNAPFAVYGRATEPCGRCGRQITRLVQSGRSTYLCPSCQRR